MQQTNNDLDFVDQSAAEPQKVIELPALTPEPAPEPTPEPAPVVIEEIKPVEEKPLAAAVVMKQNSEKPPAVKRNVSYTYTFDLLRPAK